MRRPNIDFLGNRKIMFAVSGVLLVVAIGALLLKGLAFGIEFQGGTAVDVLNTGDVTIEQMRDAFVKAGVKNANVQTTVVQGTKGFIIRTDVTDPEAAAGDVEEVAKAIGVDVADFKVTTIGPDWGSNITNRSALALIVSIGVILLYISVRFEYKMSVTSVVALAHDIVITLGIYALLGYELTPNTIAAVLTILGYSLYDTIVVFHRIKENSQNLAKQSFMQMANRSINEVIIRSLNTSITSLLPVVIMLFWGGETLRDFALALTIGLTVGMYSSIGVASPLYAMWKETEPKFAALKKKYAQA